MTRQRGLDAGFLDRLVRTTLLVGGLVVLALCATANGKWVVNYTLGVLTSVGFLRVTEMFVTQTYHAPHEVPPQRRWVGALMIGKYGALVVGLYLLGRLRYLDGVPLTAGIATLHAVLILKVFGLMLTGLWRQAAR